MNTNLMYGGETAAGNTQNSPRQRGSLWKRPAWITALVLLIPGLGNRFVDGWNWNFGGFVVAGVFLFGTCLTYELVSRKADTIAYRVAVGVALAAALLLVWMNAVWMSDAVEIVGNENPANAMYFGVPIVGIVGAAIARLRPNGMARALFAMALAQALVTGIVLVLWLPQITSWAPAAVRMFGLNAAFALLFVGSALLFQRAARAEPVL
jgi:hypothetical protein